MKLYLVLAILVMVTAASARAGEYYKWVDENGHTHFAGSLAAVPDKYKAQVQAEEEASPPVRSTVKENNPEYNSDENNYVRCGLNKFDWQSRFRDLRSQLTDCEKRIKYWQGRINGMSLSSTEGYSARQLYLAKENKEKAEGYLREYDDWANQCSVPNHWRW